MTKIEDLEFLQDLLTRVDDVHRELCTVKNDWPGLQRYPAFQRILTKLDELQTKLSGCLDGKLPAEGRFQVLERFNGFELLDTATGRAHWLSDGVDCVPHPDLPSPDLQFLWDNPVPPCLPPGGELFCRLWAGEFNADPAETLEAYFPLQTDKPDE
jgi:hypothetical protein